MSQASAETREAEVVQESSFDYCRQESSSEPHVPLHEPTLREADERGHDPSEGFGSAPSQGRTVHATSLLDEACRDDGFPPSHGAGAVGEASDSRETATSVPPDTLHDEGRGEEEDMPRRRRRSLRLQQKLVAAALEATECVRQRDSNPSWQDAASSPRAPLESGAVAEAQPKRKTRRRRSGRFGAGDVVTPMAAEPVAHLAETADGPVSTAVEDSEAADEVCGAASTDAGNAVEAPSVEELECTEELEWDTGAGLLHWGGSDDGPVEDDVWGLHGSNLSDVDERLSCRDARDPAADTVEAEERDQSGSPESEEEEGGGVEGSRDDEAKVVDVQSSGLCDAQSELQGTERVEAFNEAGEGHIQSPGISHADASCGQEAGEEVWVARGLDAQALAASLAMFSDAPVLASSLAAAAVLALINDQRAVQSGEMW